MRFPPLAPPPRTRRAAYTAILALVMLTGLVATAFADNYYNRGVAWGPNLPAIPNARGLNPMGINTFLEQEPDPTKVYYSLKVIAGGGFQWIRQGFGWNDIEVGGKGDYTDRRDPTHPKSAWDKYDFIVNEANKLGINIIARLDSTPDWARTPCDKDGLPAGCDDLKKYTKGPPTRYEDYGDFVYALVSRYKGKVRYFQIWNEPNLEGEWGGKRINAADFTRLLKIAYTRAKQANPAAVILMPGLAPTDDRTYPANESDLLYLQDMYSAGAKDYFDIASVMIYGFDEPPDTRRTEFNRFNFSRPILTHEVMVSNGDGNKPIWASEYAWLSLLPSQTWPTRVEYGYKKSMWGNGVDEATQGQWLVAGYARAAREWPWMGVMCVWKFRDPLGNPQLPATGFSIVNEDFSARPAYTALKDYSRAGGWGTVGGVGVHPNDSRAVTWQGGWQQQGDTAQGVKGDALTIRASGDAVRLRVNVPISYTLDNGPPSTASPSDGAIDLSLKPNGGQSYSDTLAVQMGGDNPQVRGFTVYRHQPLLLAWGLPAAYALTAVGLTASTLSLWPWLVYLVDWLMHALLTLLGWLLFAVRWLLRGVWRTIRRALFFLLYLILPPDTINPAITARYLPAPLASIKAARFQRWAAAGLVVGLAIFYLPVTRAELLRDINPLPLIIGGLLTAFFTLLVPEVALALVVALIPLYLQPGYADLGFITIGWGPKYIGHYYFPIAELLLLLTAALLGGRIVVGWLARRLAPADWRNVDRAQTTVIPAIRTPWAQLGQYLRTDAFALLAGLWAALGCFSLLTVADKSFRADSLRELRWTIIEPVLFYFLYVYVVGTRPHPASPNEGEVSLTSHGEELGVGDARQGKMMLIFDFLFGAAVVVSVIGIVQFFFGSNTVNVENLSRVTSVYEHPNSLALYLGRVLPLTAALALLLPATYRQRRILYAAASAVILIATYLTYSRGAILGLGGATVVIALLGGRGILVRQWQSRRNVVLVGGAVVLLVGAAGAFLALGRLFDFGSVSLRKDIWIAAINMLKDHPIFGIGLDQFYHLYPQYATAGAQAANEVFTSHPHNFVLDYWLRLGIIGLLLGGLTIFGFYRCGWRLARLTRNPLHRAIVVALLASMTDFVLHGLVDQAYFVQDLALIFWLTFAAMEMTRRLVMDEG